MNKATIVLAGSLLMLGCSSYPAKAADAGSKPAVPSDATGICFRRLTWTDKEQGLKSYVEFVVVVPSSSVERDVARVKVMSDKRSRANGPDVVPFEWIPVWINEEEIDATGEHGPDCSHLPGADQN